MELVSDLGDLVGQLYGIHADNWLAVHNGDESDVWRVDAAENAFAVHVSPSWRQPTELKWVHQLTRYVASKVPEAVPPLKNRAGETFTVLTQGSQRRLVSVYPFVEGDTLDRTDPAAVAAAGRLLAVVHRRLSTWSGPPRPYVQAAQHPSDRSLLGRVHDPQLDANRAQQLAQSPIRGVIHGDYYRRNLLAVGDHIHGLVDWHDAGLGLYVDELVWAAWEFGHDDTFCFLPDMAHSLVSAYLSTGGLVHTGDLQHAKTSMRHMLKRDILNGIEAAARAEEPIDQGYLGLQVRAFFTLADTSVSF